MRDLGQAMTLAEAVAYLEARAVRRYDGIPSYWNMDDAHAVKVVTASIDPEYLKREEHHEHRA